LLVAGACSVLGLLAELVWLAIVLEDVDDCETELSAVIAPVVPPTAAPLSRAAEPPPEQLSAILVMFEAVITLFDEAAVLLAPLLLCAFAEELLPEVEPLIETCLPTLFCSWLLSPCT